MRKLDNDINNFLREMARGVYAGRGDEGVQVVPGENYYIFAGGTKPFHAGHDQMIMHAINDAEQDPKGRVLLFIGLGDRGPLKGESMQVVWTNYIEDHYERISPNIHIEYGGGPVGKVLSLLKDANTMALSGMRPDNMFYIYSDPEDTQQYYLLPTYSKRNPGVELKSSPPKYSSALRGLDPAGVSFMGADQPDRFTRGGKDGTLDISGSKMREHLISNNIAEFSAGLPVWLDEVVKQNIFDILTGKPLNEIKRAEKGSLEYSTYLEEMMDELKYIKTGYDSRKKVSAKYRKEASKIQDAYTEIRKLKRQNDRVLEKEKLLMADPKDRFDRDAISEWFKKTRK